jgi:hypothetical protein
VTGKRRAVAPAKSDVQMSLKHEKQRGQESMLWSQFSAIFAGKVGVFLKNQCFGLSFEKTITIL